MNCSQAKKQISLLHILNRQGFEASSTKNNQGTIYHWFISPFRPTETTPSFSYNSRLNTFYDYGNGCSGTVVDYICAYYQCNIPRALELLKDFDFSFPQQKVSNKIIAKEKVKESIVIDSVNQCVSNHNLKAFLQRKRITSNVYQKYLHEIHFRLANGRNYYGVGFKNDSGAYEVAYQVWNREESGYKSIKLCLGKKDVTFIDHSANSLLITESWSDFLAFISCYPKAEYKNDFLILNSVSMADKIQTLDRHTTIYSLLDNDDAGQNLTKKIIQIYPDRAVPLNHLYSEYKDFNELLDTSEKVKANCNRFTKP